MPTVFRETLNVELESVSTKGRAIVVWIKQSQSCRAYVYRDNQDGKTSFMGDASGFEELRKLEAKANAGAKP